MRECGLVRRLFLRHPRLPEMAGVDAAGEQVHVRVLRALGLVQAGAAGKHHIGPPEKLQLELLSCGFAPLNMDSSSMQSYTVAAGAKSRVKRSAQGV